MGAGTVVVTGYQLAAVSGLHPHLTRLELWAELTGRAPRPDREDPRLVLSSFVNPAIARAYSQIRRRPVEPGVFVTHAERRFAAAKPAGLVQRTKGGEIEATLLCQRTNPWAMADWGDPDTDEVPEHVLMRATWEAAIVGAPRCDVVVPSSGIAVYPIDVDLDYFDDLADDVEAFLREHVVTDTPPPATSRDEGVLKMLHPRGNAEQSVALDPEALLAYDYGRASEKQGKAAKAAAKLSLVEALGDAAVGIADGWSVTYKNNKGSPSTDWRNLARKLGAGRDDFDELIADFTTTKPGPRVLRVKKAK